MITCHVRYEIDPAQIEAFERFAMRWMELVDRHGGTHHGYFQEDGPVVEAIRQAQADVVFVCLGAPKQEVWMAQHGPATGAHLMVGLGGVLDVYAGHVKRAPAAWQKLGLEWCYRLLHQPSRIGRMAKLPGFLVAAAGEKRKRGKP